MLGSIYSDITDHLSNFLLITNEQPQHYSKKVTLTPLVRICGETNTDTFNNILQNENWSEYLYNTQNKDEALLIFYEKYSKVYEASFPWNRLSHKKAKDTKWMTNGLKVSANKKAAFTEYFLNHPFMYAKKLTESTEIYSQLALEKQIY